MSNITEQDKRVEAATVNSIKLATTTALESYRKYKNIDGLKSYQDIILTVVETALEENADYMGSEFPNARVPFWHDKNAGRTNKEKYYHLVDLLMHCHEGGKVTHYEWPDGEYIEVIDGYFKDEKGENFTLAPWLLDDSNFMKYEESIKWT
ncbi:MAG: hypothetical protein Unbinned1322contig1000_11 [Prokaryotic dsDNA virus sp.]|nr:hypothetical protein [Aequorivita sp.]QDP57267.1 MAG: hypothetical protein Unbinned1322contig1000_11 [Prokaryotic dsDNA virus sp.]